MLVLRILGVLCLVGVGASLVAYLLSGNRRFLGYIGWILRFALAMLLLVIVLLVFERALIPLV